MSLKKQFATDKNLETKGIWVDYGDVRIRIARAGGANKKYTKRLDQLTKPVRRAIQIGSLQEERSQIILRTVFAETVVLDWQVKIGEDWKKGIDPEDAGVKADGDKLLPVNFENIVKVFTMLPDLFFDLQQQAQNGMLFQEEINEEAAKNS
ncbi:MAG: hypothetical protein PVI90_07120 [Desulfobacteraceae bacterium]|jgi:hypothetical protein